MPSPTLAAQSPLGRLLLSFSEATARDWLQQVFPGFTSGGEPLDVSAVAYRNAGCSAAKRLGTVRLKGATGAAVELPVFLATCAHLGTGPQRKTQFLCAQAMLIASWQGTGAAPVVGALIFFHAAGERRTRFSLITRREAGDKPLYRRQSFLLVPDLERNQTFRKAFGSGVVTAFGTPGEAVSRGRRETLLAKFSVEALTKEFYDRLFAWYEWAAKPATGVRFPDVAALADTDKRREALLKEHLIRLITRLMFVWFVKEKIGALARFFDAAALGKLLRDFRPTSATDGAYYNAILQNLFFATLNQPAEARAFATNRVYQGCVVDHGINTLFRDASPTSWFAESHAQVLEAFAPVPYLNGGLFECLDADDDAGHKVYHDGFSRKASARAFLPNNLFFDPTRGLLPLLAQYDFTIDENHATDADIALDPELLGKVFENLLASYNPETGASARKASGSFYTPREIVDYMIDEALRATLSRDFPEDAVAALLAGDGATLPTETRQRMAGRLRSLKTLDPACGSGAFPMGLLNRMVDLLGTLEGDAGNTYQRKLHLIQTCIYGVDIQPIAIQIAKLRFFIALLCDQSVDPNAPNSGLDQLPNLEYHLIIANTLMPLGMERSLVENDPAIKALDTERFALQEAYGRLHSRREKRDTIKRLKELQTLTYQRLEALHFGGVEQYLSWRPHDPSASAQFFDPKMMLKVEAFDVIVGNPPYVQVKKNIFPAYRYPYSEGKDKGKQNLYKVFVEASYNFAKPDGVVCLIVQSSLMCDLSSIATRELLLKKTTIHQIIEFPKDTEDPEVKVFKNVLMGTCIALFQKQLPQGNAFRLSIHNTLKTITSPTFTYLSQEAILRGGKGLEFPLLRDGEFGLFLKMRTGFRPLSSILCGQRQGNINTIHLARILSPVPTSISIGKGENIHRYVLAEDLMWATETWETRALAQDNSSNCPVLTQNITGTTDRWRIHACRAECKKRRILFLDSANITYLPSPRMALLTVGLLNSRLLDWYFRTTSTNNHVNLYELVALPIPSEEALRTKEADFLATLVEDAENESLLQEGIDALVYRLYGLTKEEIALVERAYTHEDVAAKAATVVEPEDEEL